MSSFYKLSIKEINRETKEAVSVVFNIPQELAHHYTHIAGQYVTIKLTLDNLEIRRAYSICSEPESGELRIAIKAIKNGTFSNFANTSLKVGAVLEVGTPEGKFTFEPNIDKQRNYLGFVAGSGITPVLSIIKSVLISEPNSTFVLTYGNKSVEDTVFYNQLHELQLQFVGRLFVQFVFSKIKVEGALFGRIDKSVVNFILNSKHKEIVFSKSYLCGPESMINLVSETLKEHNFKDKDIKFELFSTSTSENKTVGISNEHTNLTVIVDGEETTFEMSQKQTLLEASLKQGIDAPYSCQGGICSSCLARITEGTAVMKKNSILTDGEIAEGLILTCQAHPTSATLKIDFDDV